MPPHLGPTYKGEKGRTLGKTYWIKVRCYWEHIGNLENILGTWYNSLETRREHVGNKEKSLPPPRTTQNLKRKRKKTL